MKVVLSSRGRNRVNKGPMKSVFEARGRVKLIGVPGSTGETSFRILEDNDFRITENGDFRTLE